MEPTVIRNAETARSISREQAKWEFLHFPVLFVTAEEIDNFTPEQKKKYDDESDFRDVIVERLVYGDKKKVSEKVEIPHSTLILKTKHVKTSDELLIEEARNVSYIDWFAIEPMIEKAKSEKTKEILRGIMSSKYHTEEYYAGMI